MEKSELRIIKKQLERVIERIDSHLNEGNKNVRDMSTQEQADYIIDGACAFWGIERKELLRRSTQIGLKRKYLCALFNEYTNIGREEMARLLHYREQSTTTKNIRDMEDRLSNKSWGDGRMRSIYDNLVDYLGLPPSKIYK